jgi:hypothetical protein
MPTNLFKTEHFSNPKLFEPKTFFKPKTLLTPKPFFSNPKPLGSVPSQNGTIQRRLAKFSTGVSALMTRTNQEAKQA